MSGISVSRGIGPYRRIRVIFNLVTALAVVAGLVVYPIPAGASAGAPGDPSGRGEQCLNGGGSPLTPLPCLNGSLGGQSFIRWDRGNAGSNNAHWAEGEFSSYRLGLTGVTAGNYTLELNYITVTSSRHAFDYLGSFDATETTSPTRTPVHANNNNPCADFLGSGPGDGCTPPGTPPTPASTFPVPLADLTTQRTCGGSRGLPTVPTQVPGVFSLFAPAATGATLTGASYVSQNDVSGGTTCSTTMNVFFRTTGPSSSVVLAWGARIASVLDWGDGNSASAVTGSPYHMTVVSLSGSPAVSGRLNMSAAAIAAPPTAVTQLSATTITAGHTLTDTAHLTGSRGTVTGTAQFQLCSNTTTGCPQATGMPVGAPVALVNGSATSPAFGANLARSPSPPRAPSSGPPSIPVTRTTTRRPACARPRRWWCWSR
jgi:hypothetical protein